MMPNLQIILFFVSLVIKCFKKIFIHYLAIGNIIVYYTPIIPNISNKVANYIKFRVVRSWLT